MRSLPTFGLIAVVASFLCVGACASGGAAAGDHVQPPEMISRGAPPQLSISSLSVSGRSPVRVEIEVLIDETGRPDMSTFKATGMGAAENVEALRRWIEEAAYRPAHRGDVPVPGLYRTRIQVEIRRIG